MENDFNIGKFTQFAGCLSCGTQRCTPGDETWREACPHYDNFNSINFTDKYSAFWGGPFSNFYPCNIVHHGHEFKTSEQLFMYCKAMFFGDYDTVREILEAKTPKEAKALGRKVKDFNDDAWAQVREDMMYTAVFQKFSQNEQLRNYLLSPAFDGLKFVEGSPYDKIWGAGVSWCDPKIADEANWTGQNLLGKTLDNVRRIIKDENAGI